MSTVLVSGGFDPIHRGHISYLRAAALYGEVVVALNSDDWLVRKKGQRFQCREDRTVILQAIRYVTRVVRVDDSDGTVCAAIREIKPDFFANGGDRTPDNTPEVELCNELGISLLFRVGGGKEESSSRLLTAWTLESSKCLCGHGRNLHGQHGCHAFMGRGWICDCEDFIAQTRVG